MKSCIHCKKQVPWNSQRGGNLLNFNAHAHFLSKILKIQIKINKINVIAFNKYHNITTCRVSLFNLIIIYTYNSLMGQEKIIRFLHDKLIYLWIHRFIMIQEIIIFVLITQIFYSYLSCCTTILVQNNSGKSIFGYIKHITQVITTPMLWYER